MEDLDTVHPKRLNVTNSAAKEMNAQQKEARKDGGTCRSKLNQVPEPGK